MQQSRHHKGRGALGNPDNRYHEQQRRELHDGWSQTEQERPSTSLQVDASRSIISRNQSPDIRFEQSVNPYRGCEHGCIYCYARPSHAWLDLSPGLDFETRLLYKPNAVQLLRQALAKPGYRPSTLALSGNTDPYQPIERQLGLTRQLVELLVECRHPFLIISKSSLLTRDLDLLKEAASHGTLEVSLSLTTLDKKLARCMEPRAAGPSSRLATMETLAKAGIPVRLLAAPIIPALNEPELETLMSAARNAGASVAGYVLLRLPLEVAGMFRQWLETHYPLKARRVMSSLQSSRGGRDYQSAFGSRMSGQGVFADMLSQRFKLAARRLGFEEAQPLRTNLFQPPKGDPRQLSLF